MDQNNFIFSGRYLRVRLVASGLDTLFTTFDHWTKGKTGFSDSRVKGFHAPIGSSAVHIETAANDWFLNPDLPHCLDSLRCYASNFRRSLSIGFSMGGFGCLVMAAALRADRYVLVSPHLPPKRCLRLDALGSWNESEVQAKQSGWDGNATICYDPMIERDSHDVALIKSLVEVSSTIAMPFGGHPATNRLASENGFPEFRNEVFSQAPDMRKIQRLHQYAIRATTFPTHYSCHDNGKEVTDNIGSPSKNKKDLQLRGFGVQGSEI